jgi:hypothetical protein
MKRILQITTYDVEIPDHGGKLRSHHIRKALRRLGDVQTLSIEWGPKEQVDGLRVSLATSRMVDLELNGWLADLGIVQYFDAYPAAYDAMKNNVAAYDPDVLLIEQPYPMPVAERLIADGAIRSSAQIIYSSHNVEVDMKRKIYADLFEPAQAEALVRDVQALERGAMLGCDVLLCTTQIDADFARNVGVTVPSKVYLNGHTPPGEDASARALWSERFAAAARNFVFVGSAHMPNINGVKALLEAMPAAAAAQDLHIWALGNVGCALEDMIPELLARHPYMTITGMVSSEDIDAALSLSDAIVLPIWEGSGSNLKTAQALLTDRTVVAADFAFRGFEQFKGVRGVQIGQTPAEVAQHIMSCPTAGTHDRRTDVAALIWDSILADLPQFVEDALQDKKGR